MEIRDIQFWDLEECIGVARNKQRHRLDCARSSLSYWQGGMTNYAENWPDTEELRDECKHRDALPENQRKRASRTALIRALNVHRANQVAERTLEIQQIECNLKKIDEMMKILVTSFVAPQPSEEENAKDHSK